MTSRGRVRLRDAPLALTSTITPFGAPLCDEAHLQARMLHSLIPISGKARAVSFLESVV